MNTMNTKSKRKKSNSKPRKSAPEQVNDIILDRIRSTDLGPWERDFYFSGNDLANFTTITMPRNLKTMVCYTGSNVFTLIFAGFTSEYWLTFNQALEVALAQAKAAGRKIEKRFDTLKDGSKGKRFKYYDAETGDLFKVIKEGQTGTLAVRWVPVHYDIDGNKVEEDDPKKVRTGGFLTSFWLFNVEQTENIDYPQPKRPEPMPEEKRKLKAIAAAEGIYDGYQNAPSLEFRLLGPKDSPHYNIPRDSVVLGKMEQYKCSESFYKTKFHELVHSTGSESRLSRVGIINFDKFGSEQYSMEELIAELGAAYLSMLTGCWGERQVDNSAAYLKGWMSKLTEEPTLFCKAASQAQKAVEHIIGCPMGDFTPAA